MAIAKDVFGLALDAILNLPEDPLGLDILTYVDSQQRYEDLIIFLEKTLGNHEVKCQHINEVCNNISDSFREYKRTDASCFLSPQSRINKAYEILSYHVTKISHELSFSHMHPNMVLMPSVESAAQKLSRANLSEFKLHELLLTDDGTVMEVQKCLDEAFKHKSLYLYHTSPPYRLLTSEERERVINHSQESLEYYRKLLSYVIHTDSSKNEEHDAYLNDVLEAQKKFGKAIMSDDYRVTATFGEESEKTLIRKITEKIQTASELVDLMMMRIHPSQWQIFLNKLSNEKLLTIMLEESSLATAVGQRTNYFGDITHDKLMLLCFSEVCKRQTVNQGDQCLFKGWLPNYVNTYLGNLTLADRLGGILLLQKFLLSNEPFSDFHRYTRKHAQKPEHYQSLFMLFSNLDPLINQIVQLSDPEYYKPKPPTLVDWLSFKLL